MTAKQDPITVKYHFKDIENGQIAEGYTVLQIVNHEAEVSAADTEAMLLAEKYGGELVTQQGKLPANPDQYKSKAVERAAKGDADAPLTIIQELK